MSNKNIYLLGHYSMKPRPHVNTTKKGWMSDPANLQYDERVEITRGLKNSSIQAKIVLNLSTKTVERNGFNEDRDFKSLFKYFFGGYHKYMTQVMAQLDPNYMTEIVDELEAEMNAAIAEQAASQAEEVVEATEPVKQDEVSSS